MVSLDGVLLRVCFVSVLFSSLGVIKNLFSNFDVDALLNAT